MALSHFESVAAVPISLPLFLEASRRRQDSIFGALSRAAAASLATKDLSPLVFEIDRRSASPEDLLFMARIHGVSGLLSELADSDSAGLREQDLSAVREERRQIGERGDRLIEDLRRLGRAAEREGLPLIPLKGAFLAPERYRDLSLRPAADIDLLAPGATFEPWCRLLAAEGYLLEDESWKNRVYLRPGRREPNGFGEHPENPRPVELHQRVRERFLGRFVDLTDVFESRLTSGFIAGDIAARIPDDTALALHLFAHAAPAAIGRGLRLIQLADLAHLLPRPDTAAVLRERLGEAAWGLAALFEKALPGALPGALRAVLETAPPSPRRQRLWLSRPGLMTGDEEKRILLLRELRLCESVSHAGGRLLDALPERSVLQNLYGAETGPRYVRAMGLYLRDRFLEKTKN